MKKDKGRGKADGQGRNQGKFCSNQSFGQGHGRNCSYGKNSSEDGFRPQQSIIAAIFDGLDRIIDRSRKTIGRLSGATDQLSNSGKELENLPPGAEDSNLQVENRPQKNTQLMNKK